MMALTAERLAAHPGLVTVLGHLARGLRSVQDETPRLARALASHQRWLLSQAAFALYLEYDPSDPESGLTTVRLKEMITGIGGASRNTVLNYVDEMVSYRFGRYVDVPGKRYRRIDVLETTYAGMLRWFAANLSALDALDGGIRLAALEARPELFRIAQPIAARACLGNVRWRDPPERIAVFLWTESGGLVMDELIARADPEKQRDDWIEIGRIDARRMAEQFMMSRTHLQRLFKKAQELGCIGWSGPPRASTMWFSKGFLDEYAAWQAVKFAAVDAAFEEAMAQSASSGTCAKMLRAS